MKNGYQKTVEEVKKEAKELREATINEAIKACVRLQAGKV